SKKSVISVRRTIPMVTAFLKVPQKKSKQSTWGSQIYTTQAGETT
ncbi:hypothetical protein A2U01_0098547, partial [Trifolium medium]|nr:hypothetical protein [Trifolium medium]